MEENMSYGAVAISIYILVVPGIWAAIWSGFADQVTGWDVFEGDIDACIFGTIGVAMAMVPYAAAWPVSIGITVLVGFWYWLLKSYVVQKEGKK
jgi:hypothetical protein